MSKLKDKKFNFNVTFMKPWYKKYSLYLKQVYLKKNTRLKKTDILLQ